MNLNQQRIRILVAGILSQIVLLGIARFSYSPMLPIMINEAGLEVAAGGWLASFNYIGYLFGVIIIAYIGDAHIKELIYRVSLLMAIMTTFGMGITESSLLWGVFRFIAGFGSAIGFLVGSGLIMDWLTRNGYRSELGIHFAGIGIGIVFCSLLVEASLPQLNWSEQWELLCFFAVLFSIPAWLWMPSAANETVVKTASFSPVSLLRQRFINLIMAAYFCAGVGFVISATFIVAIVDQMPGTEGKGNLAFLLIGICAIPACIIWDFIARKIGMLNVLLIAFLVHALGIAAPVLLNNLEGVLLGSVLYGCTFISIVSMTLTVAGRLSPGNTCQMMGRMTISYSIGQILSPFVVSVIIARNGDYQTGLYMAAVVVLFGAACIQRARSNTLNGINSGDRLEVNI
ncbi:YbfB/YjiJ family MFS transporter [Vibrio sp. WJH972]